MNCHRIESHRGAGNITPLPQARPACNRSRRRRSFVSAQHLARPLRVAIQERRDVGEFGEALADAG